MKTVVFLALIIFNITPILSQWKVSTCEELNLRPIEPTTGNDLLALYLETEKFGKAGCWVHHHDNKRDFVVTPYNWSRTPYKGRQDLINEAFQALTDSRTTYEAFSPLKSDLYYVLDDVNRAGQLGEAFWLINNKCWMKSGVPELRTRSSGDRKQVYAHEVGHCFVMENVKNLKTGYSDLNNWFDESMSEYLSSVAYPANNFEHRFSKLFNFNKPFRQPYTSYPLWQQYVSRNSKTSLVPFLNELTKRKFVELRRDYMRSANFDRLLHDFFYDFFLGKMKDLAGGPIPVTSVLKKKITYLLNPEVNKIELPELDMDQVQLIEFRIPLGYDASISPASKKSISFFQSILFDKDVGVRNWNSPKFIQGNCENETSVQILLSHLNNKKLSGLSIKYELTEKEGIDECCKDGDTSDNCTQCFAPIDFDNATIKDNPTDPNEKFEFDYWIESNIEIRAEGVVQQLKANYYINTSDGSMFFPKGFVISNFGGASFKEGTVDGALWMPNGQMVRYIYDKKNAIKRAMLVDTKQTASDVFSQKYMNASHFMESIKNMTKIPDPLPKHLQLIWENSLGFEGKMFNQDGSKSKGTIYFALNPKIIPIKTDSPLVGFMSGVFKDFINHNCNKLAIFSKFAMGDDPDTSDYIQAELLSIVPKARSFDGADYKVMKIGGSRGSDYKAKMVSFEAQILVKEKEIEAAFKALKRCMLDPCRKSNKALIKQLEKEKLRIQCTLYRYVGMEDSMEECK